MKPSMHGFTTKGSEPLAGVTQRGVGLFEVLVALLVLSLGFLVSANMQLRGMRASQESYHHSQALMLANEMMDRMRSNRAAVAAGHYDDKQISATVTKPACASSGCNAQGQAQLDLYEWSAYLHNVRTSSTFIPMLPKSTDGTSATGTISKPDTNGVYTLTMGWTRQSGQQEIAESLPIEFIP